MRALQWSARRSLRRGIAAALCHPEDVAPSFLITFPTFSNSRQEDLSARLQEAVAALEASAAELQATKEAATAHHSRLQRQLEEREAVIGQLARNRDSALADRLAASQQECKRAQRRCARVAEGLGGVRQQYARLVEGAHHAIVEIEENRDEPCTCCGGSIASAAALAAFRETVSLATAHEQAVHWRQKALDSEIELVDCQDSLDNAWEQVDRLGEQLKRREAAVFHAERCAQQAEEALQQERAAHLLTQQLLKQASGGRGRGAAQPAWLLWGVLCGARLAHWLACSLEARAASCACCRPRNRMHPPPSPPSPATPPAAAMTPHPTATPTKRRSLLLALRRPSASSPAGHLQPRWWQSWSRMRLHQSRRGRTTGAPAAWC